MSTSPSPEQLIYDNSFSFLKANKSTAEPRKDEGSQCGSVQEIIAGGGIAVRLANGHAKSVPSCVSFKDVEMLKFMAVTGLTGEYVDALWWAREDQFLTTKTSANHAEVSAMKRSWARVAKDMLYKPLYAPRFPGTGGSADDWAAKTSL